MACARLMRGSHSSANPVTPAPAKAAIASLSKGSSSPTSRAACFNCGSSSRDGPRTLSTMSAPSASAAPTILAPAAAKSSSGMLDVSPAPLSTTSWCLPLAASFLTVSGVAATRVSPGRVSRGMPISIVRDQVSEVRGQGRKTGHEARHAPRWGSERVPFYFQLPPTRALQPRMRHRGTVTRGDGINPTRIVRAGQTRQESGANLGRGTAGRPADRLSDPRRGGHVLVFSSLIPVT